MGDVVGDIVQPDIPETEPDPFLYTVECAALQVNDLPGYLSWYGTWGNKILLGQNNYLNATEGRTTFYYADLESFNIIEIGSVSGVSAFPITEAIIIDENEGNAYFIVNRIIVPSGCTDSTCRDHYGSLWGIDLTNQSLFQVTDDETLSLESEFCRNHHGEVNVSAIDMAQQWVTVDCMLYFEREAPSTPLVAYETYRVHLITGEIQYLSHAEDKRYAMTAAHMDVGGNRYLFTASREWNADHTSFQFEPIGFHIWDLQGPVPVKVVEQYYSRDEIASGSAVAIDGWYYWNELVDGHLQIRGMDVATGDTLTTDGTAFEKAGAHPAGRSVPHLVSFFGGTGFVDYMGMIATTQEGMYLWDKELNIIRKATTNLPFRFGGFFNGTDSTRWFLLKAEIGSETCLFVRDLHAAGVIDPLTGRLLPEPDAGK
ncbi:hypothetical protein KKC22_04520 [Myxococcota bacterium]|nr:hypothetical protein [Myxococcota bacterium]